MAQGTNTQRGFRIYEFVDIYGDEYTLQKSSLARVNAIWFGGSGKVQQCIKGKGWVDIKLAGDTIVHSRAHLDQEQVKKLIPILQHFADHGELP